MCERVPWFYQSGSNLDLTQIAIRVSGLIIQVSSRDLVSMLIYIQQGDEVSFVIAKTRVAPLSKFTLPKLELMAALRLMKFVTESLKGHYPCMSVYLWSDSQIALHWIGSQEKKNRR